MADDKPAKKRRSGHHNLKPRRMPGNGKGLVWVCMNNKCHFADHGGVTTVYGCPKPAVQKKW